MKNQKGFTLLEVIITLGILSMVMGYFFLYFSSEISLYYANDNEMELKQDARIALDRIVGKIRSNNGLVYVPGPEGSGVIYKGTDILINTTKNDSNGEINYYFDNDKTFGQIRNSTGKVIADNIKEFRLEKEEIPGTEGLIKIYIISGNNKTDETKNFSTSVRMYHLDGL